jgi:hypothetical protein
MKGQVILVVNDDDTFSLKSSMPKDMRAPTPADYTFTNMDASLEATCKEINKIRNFDPFTKPLSIHV